MTWKMSLRDSIIQTTLKILTHANVYVFKDTCMPASLVCMRAWFHTCVWSVRLVTQPISHEWRLIENSKSEVFVFSIAIAITATSKKCITLPNKSLCLPSPALITHVYVCVCCTISLGSRCCCHGIQSLMWILVQVNTAQSQARYTVGQSLFKLVKAYSLVLSTCLWVTGPGVWPCSRLHEVEVQPCVGWTSGQSLRCVQWLSRVSCLCRSLARRPLSAGIWPSHFINV